MVYTLEYFTTLDIVLYTLMLEQSLWEYFIAAGNTDQDGSALRVIKFYFSWQPIVRRVAGFDASIYYHEDDK